ncbi:uncharacterized protein [Periplaneta americana]|uniref:uncharacterized protein n=1 Tax=Periplaneta americana TaxID=6978 RepID=UPI0037E94EAC
MQPLVIVSLVVLTVGAASAQFFQTPQQFISAPAFHPQPVFGQVNPLPDPSRQSLAHRAVVLNSEAEARLPPALKNRFYDNPRVGAALAKESWFTPGEQQVREREAEKIPRQKIYSILHNAGLVNRR